LKWVAGVVGAGGFLWLVYIGLTWDLRSEESIGSSIYRPVRVERGDLNEMVVATGRMDPHARLVVQSEIPGTVSEVMVNDGDRVVRGQPLVKLDGSRLGDQAAVLRAELEFEEARARAELVARAQAELDDAGVDHARVAKLVERGVIAQERREEAQHRVRLAEIAIATARAEEAGRRAAVKRARRNLQRVERDLEKTVIRSPIDGVVTRRHVEVGAAVADLQNGGTIVAVLADDQRIHLLGRVDENEIADVRRGQPADVYIDALPGEILRGTVREIASSGTVEGSLSRFDVKIEVEPDERIRVGMTADARIVVREHKQVVIVPNKAIQRGPEGPQVRLVIAGNGRPFELRPIRISYSDGFGTAVAEGLEEGSYVLVRSDVGE
jgi:HlyD family secretion protein